MKSLGALIAGIFVGAVGMEIIHRKCPDALDKMYARTREVASGIKESFKNGYKSAMGPQEAVKPSA